MVRTEDWSLTDRCRDARRRGRRRNGAERLILRRLLKPQASNLNLPDRNGDDAAVNEAPRVAREAVEFRSTTITFDYDYPSCLYDHNSQL